VHESVLRSDSDFPCAADRQAAEYCRAIAAEMSRMFRLSAADATERVNWQWSRPDPAGGAPRTRIVGSEDLIYHELPEYWAEFIIDRQRKYLDTAPTVPELEPAAHQPFKSRDDLDRFLHERDLTEADVRDQVQVQTPYPGAPDRTYLHQSVVQSDGLGRPGR
jgi:hypothetical protein